MFRNLLNLFRIFFRKFTTKSFDSRSSTRSSIENPGYQHSVESPIDSGPGPSTSGASNGSGANNGVKKHKFKGEQDWRNTSITVYVNEDLRKPQKKKKIRKEESQDDSYENECVVNNLKKPQRPVPPKAKKEATGKQNAKKSSGKKGGKKSKTQPRESDIYVNDDGISEHVYEPVEESCHDYEPVPEDVTSSRADIVATEQKKSSDKKAGKVKKQTTGTKGKVPVDKKKPMAAARGNKQDKTKKPNVAEDSDDSLPDYENV